MADIQQRVIKTLASIVELAAPPRLSDDLYADVDLDSLEVASFMIGLEDEFNINISDKEADDIRTLNDVCAFVSQRYSLAAN